MTAQATDFTQLHSSRFDAACSWLAGAFRKQFSRGSVTTNGPTRLDPPVALPSLVLQQEYYEHESMRYGSRYRSAFLVNFLLGLTAVGIALVPLAGLLDDHALHTWGAALTVAEMACILAILMLHLVGREQPHAAHGHHGHQDHAGHHGGGAGRVLRLFGIAPNQAWRKNWVENRLYTEQLRYGELFVGFPGAVIVPGHDASHLLDMGLDSALRRWFEQEGAACRAQPLDAAYMTRYRAYLAYMIENQRVYHANNGARCHQIHHRLHSLGNLAFWLTLAGCLLHLVWHAPLLSVLAAFLPATAAVCHGIISAGEYAKLADVSDQMQAALAKLQRTQATADAAPTLERQAAALHDVLQQLYDLTISEARGWHLAMRDKDIHVG